MARFSFEEGKANALRKAVANIADDYLWHGAPHDSHDRIIEWLAGNGVTWAKDVAHENIVEAIEQLGLPQADDYEE